jgi:hypothetical protein
MIKTTVSQGFIDKKYPLRMTDKMDLYTHPNRLRF